MPACAKPGSTSTTAAVPRWSLTRCSSVETRATTRWPSPMLSWCPSHDRTDGRGQGRRLVGEQGMLTTLNPGASVVDWVVSTMETLGSGWCSPGLDGIGVGGAKAMVVAGEVLNEPIDMADLQAWSGEPQRRNARRARRGRSMRSASARRPGRAHDGGRRQDRDLSFACSVQTGSADPCNALRTGTSSWTLDGSGPAYSSRGSPTGRK